MRGPTESRVPWLEVLIRLVFTTTVSSVPVGTLKVDMLPEPVKVSGPLYFGVRRVVAAMIIPKCRYGGGLVLE